MQRYIVAAQGEMSRGGISFFRVGLAGQFGAGQDVGQQQPAVRV